MSRSRPCKPPWRGGSSRKSNSLRSRPSPYRSLALSHKPQGSQTSTHAKRHLLWLWRCRSAVGSRDSTCSGQDHAPKRRRCRDRPGLEKPLLKKPHSLAVSWKQPPGRLCRRTSGDLLLQSECSVWHGRMFGQRQVADGIALEGLTLNNRILRYDAGENW